MSREVEDLNRRLLRAHDAMDRAYAEPLDVRPWPRWPISLRRISSFGEAAAKAAR